MVVWQGAEGSTGKELSILISDRAKGDTPSVTTSSPKIEAWMLNGVQGRRLVNIKYRDMDSVGGGEMVDSER